MRVEDTTKKELAAPPETAFEANQQFYTPSERYRKVMDILDKDINLANFNQKDRREFTLIVRIMLNAIKLEDMRGWRDEVSREISNYWVQRAAILVSETRATDGFTARLSKTNIAEQTYKGTEQVTQRSDKPGNPFEALLPKGGR
jgi:hypothetical protein